MKQRKLEGFGDESLEIYIPVATYLPAYVPSPPLEQDDFHSIIEEWWMYFMWKYDLFW
ncbi:MAG TPA: hypothetical protein VE619_00860 [Nitrososphaeraceae archaeon]|jgi:hypothetical protein|nr:hypothetical protein [Nitrososphaeraceae archaeon]